MPLKIAKRLSKPHPAQNFAPQQEREAAQRIGGRVVRGSGCGLEKGDARALGIVRVECKSTSHASFSITRAMLDKLERATAGTRELPIIEVKFINKNQKVLGAACVMPLWALETIAEHAKENQA